jgi:hypothetical protein
MEVVVTGHNFESILPKDHPCHVCLRPKERAKILDDFDHCVIKRTIHGLYSRKIAPTVSIIARIFQSRHQLIFKPLKKDKTIHLLGDSHHPLIWPETLNRSRQKSCSQKLSYTTQHSLFCYWYQKSIIWKNRTKKDPSKTDKIANLHGHEVIRTPSTTLLSIQFSLQYSFFNFDHMLFCFCPHIFCNFSESGVREFF